MKNNEEYVLIAGSVAECNSVWGSVFDPAVPFAAVSPSLPLHQTG